MPHPKVKISDNSGNEVGISTDGLTNRLKVDSDDAFTSWTTYQAFEVPVTATAISADTPDGTGASISDAKEIMIQADENNDGYIMVGSSAATTVIHGTVTSRFGIKLDRGETIILAIGAFSKVFLRASVANCDVYVAYFK